MTKLLQWLLGGLLCLAVWLSLLTNIFESEFIQNWMHIILILPVIVVGVFGIYAAFVVLWRVYTFNDCEDAAKELQQQILEAKDDLRKKGFVFETTDKKSD
ncbi:dolichol-phosphate mannosyltransferase subunit 3 [Homalodisca vitripennis]|uniref:dolichol-phosphate mannosyltransferase subunit 3 n=1 Tax=Homalodisca vitripennis TaxID=197043 RepID=UPI001EEB9F1E|nr:dolichol-phosphate mannosyltransferase subunit 3 [Homalodisca vitripennis]KAG8250431.1 Dolichol-phosphate mannosyltransferase subunit 3 [Homalodisca vitripennis]